MNRWSDRIARVYARGMTGRPADSAEMSVARGSPLNRAGERSLKGRRPRLFVSPAVFFSEER